MPAGALAKVGRLRHPPPEGGEIGEHRPLQGTGAIIYPLGDSRELTGSPETSRTYSLLSSLYYEL